MKKISFLLLITFILGLVLACRNGLIGDPRLYNKKSTSTNQKFADEGAFELLSHNAVDPFDLTDEWYNRPDSNGDETNEPADGSGADSQIDNFPADEFKNLRIAGKFGGNNEPSYTMFSGGWSEGNAEKKESTYSGDNTEGQGWSISSVTYYRYAGLNQLYSPTGSYNTQLQSTANGNPKLSRFYFYRFTGKGGGVQALDNCLVAIDSYSKLVFAYGAPDAANSFGAPTSWKAVDSVKYTNGKQYMFYEYDPVGYVKKTDSGYEVVMYEWFTTQIATTSDNYGASVNPRYAGKVSGSDVAVAKKTPDGAGRSPFNATNNAELFVDNLKNLSSQKFQVRPKWEGGENGDTLYTYSISADGKTITRSEAKWEYGGNVATDAKTTYTYKSNDSAVLGVFTSDNMEYTVELVDNFNGLKLTKKGEESELVAKINYQDKGADFLLRVRGKTFENVPDGTKYVFTADGKSVTMDYSGKTGTYSWGSPASTNEGGWYDGYYFKLYDNDITIRVATTKVAEWAAIMEWPAYLKREGEAATFADNVKGLEFKWRDVSDHDSGNGKSLTLRTVHFSGDGKTATLKTETWLKNDETTVLTLSAPSSDTNTTTATYTKDNSSVTFSLSASGSNGWLDTLKVEYSDSSWNADYKMSYADPGPVFLDRVKSTSGITFRSNDGKTTYTFSPDGRTLQFKFDGAWYELDYDYKYTYVQPRDASDSKLNNCAVYGSEDAALYYAGFELTQNDSVITTSAESAGWASTVVWRMTYEAYRQTE